MSDQSEDFGWMVIKHRGLQPGMLRFMGKSSEDTQRGCPLLRVVGAAGQSFTHMFWEGASDTAAHLTSSLNPHVYATPASHSYSASLHHCVRAQRSIRKNKCHFSWPGYDITMGLANFAEET